MIWLDEQLVEHPDSGAWLKIDLKIFLRDW